MMNLKETLRLLFEMDQLPDITRPRLGRWVMWNVVKAALCPTLLETELYSNPLYKSSRRLKYIMNVVRYVPTGIFKMVVNSGLRRKPHIFTICHSNSCRTQTPKGRYLDVYLDELLISGKLSCPPFVVETPAGWPHLHPTVGPRHTFEEPLMVAIRALKALYMRSRKIQDARNDMIKVLARASLPFDPKTLEGLFTNLFAQFEAERKVYYHYLKGSPVQGLMAVDIFGFFGKIAAARELGIPVVDFQHGLINPTHQYYIMDGYLKAAKKDMPLPDKILVYGNYFKKMLCTTGFWSLDEVATVGSANMDRFRAASKQIPMEGKQKLRLFFTTQWVTQRDALRFWTRFLETHAPFDYELILKIHPYEKWDIHKYRVLEKQHPKLCKVVFDEEDTYSLLLGSDFNISYHSSVLMESIPLGIPSISICGQSNPGGFAGSLDLPEFSRVIKHVHSEDELQNLIQKYLDTPSFRDDWKSTISNFGKNLFEPGFIDNSSRVINQTLELYPAKAAV